MLFLHKRRWDEMEQAQSKELEKTVYRVQGFT
jgi:hypothetical protein